MSAWRSRRPIISVFLLVLAVTLLPGCGKQVTEQTAPDATSATPTPTLTPVTTPTPSAPSPAPTAKPSTTSAPADPPATQAPAPAPATTPAPAIAPAPAVAPAPAEAPAPAAPAPVVQAPPATSANDPQFATCKAAIAAGYGNYVQGNDPEYAWYNDRDGDGVVCEK
ncbi:hypothetical protein DDP54_13420 [Cellulomonas sp. WB94]|nr:hypothetical protein DDP54_13420 [Cellulomonas sp. WB94]